MTCDKTQMRMTHMQSGIQIGDGSRRRSQACRLLLLVVAMILPVAPGCEKGRELTPVTGKVTYQGRPLAFGTVMLQAANGQPATGTINTDGTFQVETYGEGGGAPIGQLRVRVLCFECQGPNPPTNGGQGRPLIPKKYTTYAMSGLTFEVKPGETQELNIDLTDP